MGVCRCERSQTGADLFHIAISFFSFSLLGKMKELQVLIKENYVEDKTESFRLVYSSDFISW